MDFNWDNEIRQRVADFNRKLMAGPNPMTGYAEGGSQPVGLPGRGGSIPGPVDLATGDDTMTPMKMGEYVIPVEAVLAIGKHALDQQVMGLKQEMGDYEPVRNLGGSEQGYAEGGQVKKFASDWVYNDKSIIHEGNPYPAGLPHYSGLPSPNSVPRQVGADYPQAGAGWAKAGADFPVAGEGWPKAGEDFPKAGYAEGGAVGDDYPKAGADFPKAGADFSRAGADFPKAGEGWASPDTITTTPPTTFTPAVPPTLGGAVADQTDTRYEYRPRRYGSGYSEGGIVEDAPFTDALYRTGFSSKPLDIRQPAGIPAAPPPPSTDPVLLKVGAGDTGRGYERGATITQGNIDKYVGLHDSRGAVANTPNNIPDLAKSVQAIRDTPGTGTDITQSHGYGPTVIMRGRLDAETGGKLHDRVDWSVGSKNQRDGAAAAKFKNEEASAARFKAIQNQPRYLDQHMTGITNGNNTWGLAPEVQRTIATENFKADAANQHFDTNAGLEAAKIAATSGLNQSIIGKNNAEAEKDKATAKALLDGGELKPTGVDDYGNTVYSNKKGQEFVNGQPRTGRVFNKQTLGSSSTTKQTPEEKLKVDMFKKADSEYNNLMKIAATGYKGQIFIDGEQHSFDGGKEAQAAVTRLAEDLKNNMLSVHRGWALEYHPNWAEHPGREEASSAAEQAIRTVWQSNLSPNEKTSRVQGIIAKFNQMKL